MFCDLEHDKKVGGRLPASSRVCFKSLDKFILFNCYSLLCRVLGVNFLTVDGLVSSYTYIVFAAFAQSLQSNIQFLCICFLSTLEVCFLGVLYLIAVCTFYFFHFDNCSFALSGYFLNGCFFRFKCILFKFCINLFYDAWGSFDYELSAFRDCDKLRIAGTKVCNYEYEVRNHSYGIL